MGVLDGFLSTWSGARATFGDGVPQDGSRFDQSATLTQLRDNVDAAKPREWRGTASDSYASANATQSHILGELSGLDRRLGAEVTRSAEVVTAGRRDLDAVRKWVLDAAATVPPTAAGERTLIPIVAKGNARSPTSSPARTAISVQSRSASRGSAASTHCSALGRAATVTRTTRTASHRTTRPNPVSRRFRLRRRGNPTTTGRAIGVRSRGTPAVTMWR